MRIIWSQQARLDLQQIYGHIPPDSPKSARQLHERIQECILLSAETPQIGRPGRVPGTREMVISGTCYIVPYRIVGNTLQILRVYHTARQWPEVFEPKSGS